MAQEKQGSQGQEINGNLEIKIVFFMMSGFSEGEKNCPVRSGVSLDSDELMASSCFLFVSLS